MYLKSWNLLADKLKSYVLYIVLKSVFENIIRKTGRQNYCFKSSLEKLEGTLLSYLEITTGGFRNTNAKFVF